MNVLEIEFGLVCGLGYRSGYTGMGAERGKVSDMTRVGLSLEALVLSWCNFQTWLVIYSI